MRSWKFLALSSIFFVCGWYMHGRVESPEFVLPEAMAEGPHGILEAAFCFECKGVYSRAPINLPDERWLVKDVAVDMAAHTITCNKDSN